MLLNCTEFITWTASSNPQAGQSYSDYFTFWLSYSQLAKFLKYSWASSLSHTALSGIFTFINSVTYHENSFGI